MFVEARAGMLISPQLRRLTWLSYLSMASFGATLSVIGAVLPAVSRDLALDKAQAGFLAAVPAIGFAVATLCGGVLIDRAGLRKIMLVGAVGQSLALLGISQAPGFVFLALAFLLNGLAGGSLEACCNTLIATLYRGRAAGQMNMLHVFFGIGAFLSPLAAGVLVGAGLGWRLVYGAMILIYLGLILVIWREVFPAGSSGEEDQITRAGFKALLLHPLVLLVVIAMFFSVAAEVGFSSWVSTFLLENRGQSAVIAGAGLSVFWLAMLMGRFLASRVAHRFTGPRLILAASLTGSVGVALFLLLPSMPVPAGGSIGTAFLCIFLAGLGMSSVFPSTLAFITESVPRYTGTVTGIVVSSAGIGSTAGPWVIGELAKSNGLALALATVVISLGVVAVVFAGVLRLKFAEGTQHRDLTLSRKLP
ncbi:MAG: MFS transporter [Chloroflexi bacterium]|nr:MFS transporter [Chloroflexota bacterium]